MATPIPVEWINLASTPLSSITNGLMIPAGTNKNNYIVVEFDHDNEDKIFIYKYNIEANKWTTTDLLGDSVDDLMAMGYSLDPALDTKQNVLYFVYQNYLTKIELNTKQITKYVIASDHDGTSQCVILNDELFVIGGEESHSISKWNKNTNELTPSSILYDKTKLDLFEVTCHNNTNSMLIFGGYDNETDEYVDYILEYNPSTNKCNKLAISLPRAMSSACCLKAINETYVLIFGVCHGKGWSDEIYMYSMKRQIITKSKIKCPSTNPFSGIIVNDKIKDEKSVFGFVRNTWKTCKIEDHYFPPFYLLKIIHSYYLNEWVFLVDKVTGQHYKMSTLDIVQ